MTFQGFATYKNVYFSGCGILFQSINLLSGTWQYSGVPYCNSHHQEETANEKKTINFLKLSAPWEVLVFHAEEMCIRAPLQVRFGKGYGKKYPNLKSPVC